MQVDELTYYALGAHDKYGLRTFLAGGSATVPDGVLGLYAEEKAGRKAVDADHAGHPIRVLHRSVQVGGHCQVVFWV